MDNIPVIKRQKLSETSFDQVKDELESVINLRKNIGGLLEQIYSAETSQLLKRLERIELQLNKIETYEVPDMGPIFQGFRRLSKEYDETMQKIDKHIPLLNILEKMKICPIAQIIDEI